MVFGPGSAGETGTETETFEGLVEDDHDVERCELVSCYGESEADEDGVEDDAEFEDEDGCHLRAEIFDGAGVLVIVTCLSVGVVVGA